MLSLLLVVLLVLVVLLLELFVYSATKTIYFFNFSINSTDEFMEFSAFFANRKWWKTTQFISFLMIFDEELK